MKIYKVLNRTNRKRITLRQLMLLLDLCDDQLTPSTIADRLNISGAAVTLIVDRMEQLGYVVRSHAKSDRRKILVDITRLGREVCDEITKA
jgi:DNA-binding MarR family transcriptional regulator